MRTLYLLRHAKSSWKDASLDDFNRPLNERGREAAELMGRFIASENVSLSLLISSPAVRTRETTQILLRLAGLSTEPRFDDRIYEAELPTLVQVVSEISDDNEEAMLVGHNPGMEELLAFLTQENRHMQTCALAKIKLYFSSWKEIGQGTGELEWFVTPNDLLST